MTIIDFFTDIVGEVPAELESLVYVFGIIVLCFICKCFFELISSVFGVTKWTRSN